jgi:alcohol dehydrogenase (cytochrome c)
MRPPADLLWQYSHRLGPGRAPSVKRAISIYGTRLYVPTSDAHIVALDAKTGKVVWDEAIADAKAGYGLTGGPLVANGKVMVGTTGRAPGGNFIVALDAETGKRAWRINTIAQPGENGGNSWNGLHEREAQRRVGVGTGQLRPCAEPRVLRTGADYQLDPNVASARSTKTRGSAHGP